MLEWVQQPQNLVPYAIRYANDASVAIDRSAPSPTKDATGERRPILIMTESSHDDALSIPAGGTENAHHPDSNLRPQDTSSSSRDTQSWRAAIDTHIESAFSRIQALRRHLHQHPEPSGQERKTARYVAGLLREEGFHVREVADGRGLLVEPQGLPPALPRIALRADMDALRIHDAKQVAYRSTHEGLTHACGHDAHTATLFGALLGLNRASQDGQLPWPIAWRAIFQPAEETSEGAIQMIADGALEGVAGILAAHVDPSRPVGRLGLRTGMLTANCDAMEIIVRGRGGHAARPHETTDPITAACQLVSTLYMFVPRSTDSQDSVVLSIGQIAGGENANVIPEEVMLRGTLRTLNRTVRDRTIEHIRHLVRGMAETSRTDIEFKLFGSCEGVGNHGQMTELIREVADDLLGSDQYDRIQRASMGSEDFSAYVNQVPGSMFRLGCRGEDIGSAPLHSPWFDIDERAMSIGAKIFARAVVTWCDPARQTARSLPAETNPTE